MTVLSPYCHPFITLHPVESQCNMRKGDGVTVILYNSTVSLGYPQTTIKRRKENMSDSVLLHADIFSFSHDAEQFVSLQRERPMGMLHDVGNGVAQDDAVALGVACVERLQAKPHPHPLS